MFNFLLNTKHCYKNSISCGIANPGHKKIHMLCSGTDATWMHAEICSFAEKLRKSNRSTLGLVDCSAKGFNRIELKAIKPILRAAHELAKGREICDITVWATPTSPISRELRKYFPKSKITYKALHTPLKRSTALRRLCLYFGTGFLLLFGVLCVVRVNSCNNTS